MLSCHRSVIIRSLGLLGLVVLMVMVTDSVWALSDNYLRVKDATGGLGVFPYLSPVPEQRSILANAFNFQMSLFGAINGSASNAIKSLHYLAVTAALVGGLLTIFNPKYRKMPIMASWVLLVIITVFAPYGSKMLFYPIAPQGGLTRGLAQSDEPTGDCISYAKNCGFAPQLAAVHVASVVQLILSDLFNSMDWKTLVGESLSRENLKNNNKLVASPEWPDKIKDYGDLCSAYDFNKLMEYRQKKSVGGLDDTNILPTLSDQWNKIARPFLNPSQTGNEIYPPQAIRLYDESDFPTSDGRGEKETGWDTKAGISDYENGITNLYRLYTNDISTVTFNGSGQGVISIKAALTVLDQQFHFFELEKCGWTNASCKPDTGFVFVWSGAKNTDGAQSGDQSAEAYRKCFNSVLIADGSVCGGVKNPNIFSSAFKEMFTKPSPDTLGKTRWAALIKNDALNSDWARKMPVGVVNYSLGGGSTAAPVASNDATRSCLKEGNRLIDEGINWTIGQTGKAKQLEPMRKLLIEGRSIAGSNVPGQPTLQLSQLYDKKSACTVSGSCLYEDTQGNDLLMAQQFIDSFKTAEGDQAQKLGHELNDVERYNVLVKLVLDSMDGSTSMFRKNTPTVIGQAAEGQAAKDSTAVDIVGINALSTVGGWGAIVFGKIVAGFGAWLAGPLSVAIVYFISLLVDMSLLLLIVLTPILFLVGLVVPSMAMGVLTISIMGAFILKAVPITLLVLNNIGGMIYAMIGAGGGDNAGTMQSLMILAMAGLYANLVGMTFFLIFKLGDPATILGRMTALDSAGKQIADRGMAAAIGAATVVAGLAAGGAYGLLGNTMAGRGAKLAADKLGGTSMISKAKALTGDGATKAGQEGVTSETGTPTDPNALDDKQVAGMASAIDAFGIEDPKDAEALVRDGEFTDKNGAQFKFDKETGLVTRNGMGLDSADDSIPGVTKMSSAVEGLGSPDDVNPTLPKPSEGPGSAAPPIPGGPTSPQLPGAPGAAAVQGSGVAQQVSVVGGTLNSVGEIGKMQGGGDVSQLLAEQKTAEIAKEAKERQDIIDNGQFKNETTKSALQEANNAFKNAETDEQRAEAGAQFKNVLVTKEGMSEAMAKAGQLSRRNLEDDLVVETQGHIKDFDDRISALDKMIDGESVQGKKDDLVKQRDQLKKERQDMALLNPVSLTEAEMLGRLGSMKEMSDAMNTLGAADYRPSNLQAFMSGVYGAGSGASGGLARIPIIGSAISETLNEFYQAPERARAVNAAGGFKKWWTAQGDAQRMGFYNKEMAPLGAAQQYQTMADVGAFQAQADITRQTATEAVMKSRSQYEAMVVNSVNNPLNDGIKVNSVNFTNYMSGSQLAGLGRQEAADRIASVRQEAALMQTSPVKVERAYIADKEGNYVYENGQRVTAVDENMRLKALKEGQQIKVDKDDEAVALTPQALGWLRGNLTTKRIANNFDEMMIAHYGLTEKQYLRGSVNWDRTRNMNTDKEAAATFARQDVSTDYLIGGHLKMVEGKVRFKDSQGQYQRLVEFRNDEGRQKLEFLQTQLATNGGDVKALLTAAKFKEDDFKGTADELSRARREALDKFARDESKKAGTLLKMEAIFDEAAANGLFKYEEKVIIAQARDATRDSKLYESASKEYKRVLEGVSTLPVDAMKKNMMNWAGKRVTQDEFTQVVFDRAMKSGVKLDGMGQFMNVISDTLGKVKDGVKIWSGSVNATINGDRKQEVMLATQDINKELYAQFEAARNAASGPLKEQLTGFIKSFKTVTDKKGDVSYRLTSDAVDSQGQHYANAEITDVEPAPQDTESKSKRARSKRRETPPV